MPDPNNPANIRSQRTDLSAAPGDHYVKIVKGTPFSQCRALCVGTAGSADLTRSDNTVAVGYPLFVGYHPISCKMVANGAADDIWAIY